MSDIKVLQDHLQKHPNISHVHFNEAGNWQFHERPSHPIKKTRDEVLGMKPKKEKAEPAPEEGAENDKPEKAKGKGGKKAAEPAPEEGAENGEGNEATE